MHIELREATKKYSRTTALDSLSVSFDPGELVAILGLNGAGKSTLLRALSGSIGLNSGELLYGGDSFSYDNLEMRRALLFIPDTPPLLYGESVLRNISIFLTQYQKTDDPEMGARIIELLEEFDLVEKAESPVDMLSRGQAYKVGLIILAAVNPQIWILDEPFASGMDANGIRLFRKLSREAVASGRTVIYSTQLVDLTENFATRVCLINKGTIYASLDPEDLRKLSETDHLVAKLIGEG